MTKITDFVNSEKEIQATPKEFFKEGAGVPPNMFCMDIIERAKEIQNTKKKYTRYIEKYICSVAENITDLMLIENSTLEEVNKEAYKMSEFLNQIPEVAIRVHAKCIMSKVRNNILKEMNLEAHEVKKYDTEMKEIKNTDGDTVVKVNEDGIVVAGVLKINKEQDQEMGVINYLPVESIKCNLAPEFIKQVTEEVIKKMKEDHISFGKIQLPSGQLAIDVNKITSNAGSSVIMDKEGVVTAKVGDTSVTTTKEGMICKVDNKTSNTEDIEVNKEKDSEASSVTVNIKIPETVQELINSYSELFETISKVLKEAEEKANCEIEALKAEVNSLKTENDKLEGIIKKAKADHINFAETKQPCEEIEMNSNNVTSKTEGRILNKVEVSYLEAYKEITEYLMKRKNIQLERIGTDGVIKVIRIIKELKNSPYDNAISILNNCKTIIPCVSTVKTKNEKII